MTTPQNESPRRTAEPGDPPDPDVTPMGTEGAQRDDGPDSLAEATSEPAPEGSITQPDPADTPPATGADRG